VRNPFIRKTPWDKALDVMHGHPDVLAADARVKQLQEDVKTARQEADDIAYRVYSEALESENSKCQ
jgi:hypothetical protein